MKSLRSLSAVAVATICLSSTTDALIWTDGFEDGGTTDVGIATAFPGIWTGTGTQPTLKNETFSTRPAGMTSTDRAAAGPTSGNFISTRSLLTDYTTGTVTVEGWLQSRSNAPTNANYAALGLSTVERSGQGHSEIMLRYLWSTGEIEVLDSFGAVLTSGDAYGTDQPSPDYNNSDPDNYNQWQHVLLEVDLDKQKARAFLDGDQSTPGGPWVQLGQTVDTTAQSISSIGYASLLTSRDGIVDDMVTDTTPIPEPATLSVLALSGILCLLRRHR